MKYYPQNRRSRKGGRKDMAWAGPEPFRIAHSPAIAGYLFGRQTER